MQAANVRKADMRQYDPLLFFKSLALFTDLPSEDVKRFSDAAHIKNYKKGKVLFTENEKAEFFYIILSGWLRLFHTTMEGEEINLAMLTAHTIVGESALFENGSYTNSAEIAEDLQVLSIPLALLKDYLRVSQQMAFNMLTVMTQYQRRHTLQLENFQLYSAPQRIGCFLLGLCVTPPEKINSVVKLNLPYDKALIASTLGMKGATFSRALNILRKETGIQIRGTLVTIDSIKRLLKFVDGCYLDAPLKKIQAE